MLKEGDRVRVYLPKTETTIIGAVRAFNGMETKITKVHHKPKVIAAQYTLEGCVSKFGTPYFFLGEWLIPLESEV